MRIRLGGLLAVLGALGVGGSALAHELDHAPPNFSAPAPLSTAINAGGENAEWELVATIPTGNPHSDIDFFTREGITYASVGTLALGPNAAGQTIIQLTDADGAVDPHYITGHPSASCPGVATGVTGLQHDAEAAPKGDALVQFPNPYVDTRDTQIVVDATDASGRCHDQGELGLSNTPQGGLEIIDVTDPAAPTEIGLTSHVGEAHTVNIDPKRPHIAFVSSSDGVSFDEEGVRSNEEGDSMSFDGIEVVDMSSCMNFPADASRQFKIDACDPEVYRFRWPTINFARSSTYRSVSACHELEIYPDDTVTCAAIDSSVVMDFSNAFDDNGTPNDFSDDKPRGTPLPCARRASSTAAAPWATSAFVEDCVVGEGGQSLVVSEWLQMSPRPSLQGVLKNGAVHHMGFEDQIGNNFEPLFDSTEDIFVSHEAELTQSGRFMLVTDERGGGILPGGASCTQGADNPIGNGGVHAFPVSKIGTLPPEPAGERTAEIEAYQEKVYAKTSDGERAIFRAPIQTEPQGSLCTSHVFQQIPGQNRIFMAWYSQGTQVVDFTENADGTIDFKRAGYFVPEHANQWVSHVFKVEENDDGSFTYWGATGDFLLGDGGRNAIDVYKVTLPPPPKPRGKPLPGTPDFPGGGDACAAASGFNFVGARPERNGKQVRFLVGRRSAAGVDVTTYRRSQGRRVIRRKVRTFRNQSGDFTWAPRRAKKGFYDTRFVTRAPNGKKDVRHVSLRRKRGRFFLIPYFDYRNTCGLIKHATLGRSVFNGRRRTPLRVRFTLAQSARVKIQLRHRNGTLAGKRTANYTRGRHSVKFRLAPKTRRGAYRAVISANRPSQASSVTIRSRAL
ncbi:MAG TPA: hypothetical protein VD790_04535 [Thermoleophilaceae bacterium]|nr:hypothetical protein [Thermoleophilaceae bacterium]